MSEMLDFVNSIEREFGKGVKPRGLAKVEKEIQQKKNTMDKWRERLSRDRARYESNKENKTFEADMNDALEGFQKAEKEYEQAKELLRSGDVFGQSTPDKTLGLIPCEGDINLADLYDVRFETDGKTARLVVENYGDTSTISEVAEGEAIPESHILDCVTSIKTDRDSIKKIASILNVPEMMLEDDENLRNGAIDSVQEKHTANTETLLLCRAIQTSKGAVNVTTETLSNVVNGSLNNRAKIRAEIITNESGFGKLDIKDASGNSYMKKHFDIGEFVFDDRFIVRVVSDDILENNEDGSAPVFVGDWKNVLRLAVVKKYPPLEKVELYDCVVKNRAIKKIIPLLTTTSDKAFIVGSLM